MIVARGTVVATDDSSSLIKFEYAKCVGCTNQCPRAKLNEFLHPEQMIVGSNVLLNIPSSGLSVALFILLGVPMLACVLGLTLTRSVLFACLSLAIALLVNVGLFRRFSLADSLLRPTIRRIN